jgi:hypothetical protein
LREYEVFLRVVAELRKAQAITDHLLDDVVVRLSAVVEGLDPAFEDIEKLRHVGVLFAQ